MELRHLIRIQVAVCAGGALVCLRLGAARRRAHALRRAVHAADTGTGATGDQRPAAMGAGDLAALTYELLDAHVDTARLADGLTCDPSWEAHLDYLRALQRTGREMLAHATAEELSPYQCSEARHRTEPRG